MHPGFPLRGNLSHLLKARSQLLLHMQQTGEQPSVTTTTVPVTRVQLNPTEHAPSYWLDHTSADGRWKMEDGRWSLVILGLPIVPSSGCSVVFIYDTMTFYGAILVQMAKPCLIYRKGKKT